jgi:hypothetical protein
VPHLEAPGATYLITFRFRSRAGLSPNERGFVKDAIEACDGHSIHLDAAAAGERVFRAHAKSWDLMSRTSSGSAPNQAIRLA